MYNKISFLDLSIHRIQCYWKTKAFQDIALHNLDKWESRLLLPLDNYCNDI